MAPSKEFIIKDIRKFIGKDKFSMWYFGITNDPERRLFKEHNVHEKRGNYIWHTTNSLNIARVIERLFIFQFGCKGNIGGGNCKSVFVYAYKRTKNTVE